MLRREFLPLLAAFPPADPKVADFRGRTLDGRSFTRETFRGKPLLIQFWATWCGYCRRDQPEMEAVREKYLDRLTMLAVNVNESAQKVKGYLAENPRRVPVVLSQETNLFQIFRPEGYPHYVLIGAESHILAEQSGARGRAGLEAMLKRAF